MLQENEPQLELYTYEYFMQENVCRFCWSKNACISIKFESFHSDSIENDINIAEKIKECLQIDICTSEYPKRICNACCTQIEKFYDFKKFCRTSYEKLHEIIKKEPMPPEFENGIDFDIDLCEKSFHNDNFSDLKEDFIDDDPKEIKNSKYKLKRTPTYCNICCIDLHTADNLEDHNSKNHGIQNGEYKCFGCEKTFKNRKLRLGHETKYCKGLKNGYKCLICLKYLPTRRKYEEHRRDHRNNIIKEIPPDIFKCIHCDKLFDNKDTLKQHLSEHGDKKLFICESCGRVFTRQDYLRKHMSVHTGEKQYACNYCMFRASQRSALTVHIRKHTGERPYSCDLCPQKCISSSNLRAHRQRHLGLKQYECAACDKKFGYKVSLTEHIAHAHSAAQTHACECGATYSRPRALKRHKAAKHADLSVQ